MASPDVDGFVRRLLGALDAFVPESVRAKGREAIRRARLIVATSSSMAFLLASGTTSDSMKGEATTTVSTLLGAAALAGMPFLLRRSGRLALAGNLTVAVLFTLVAGASFSPAEPPAGTLLAATAIPLLGVFLTGARAGAFWGLLAALQLAVVGTVLGRTIALPAAGVVLAILGFVLLLRALDRDDRAEMDGARERAERADRLKSDFVASVSHEMRTPLNVMVGMIDMLLDTRLSDAQASLARTLRVSTMNLLRLVNDVVDLSRIEAGRLELQAVPFDVRACVAEVAEQLEYPAREKGLGLDLVLDPALPGAVVGDPARLRQVLTNLLANAIKFTPQGRTGIEARVVEQGENDVVLSFAVTDTGVGIPTDEIPRLFQRFTQIHGSAARTGGSGLGLAISRELVVRMDGQLSVESRQGAGSRFEFRLPMRVSTPASSTIEVEPDRRAVAS